MNSYYKVKSYQRFERMSQQFEDHAHHYHDQLSSYSQESNQLRQPPALQIHPEYQINQKEEEEQQIEQITSDQQPHQQLTLSEQTIQTIFKVIEQHQNVVMYQKKLSDSVIQTLHECVSAQNQVNNLNEIRDSFISMQDNYQSIINLQKYIVDHLDNNSHLIWKIDQMAQTSIQFQKSASIDEKRTQITVRRGNRDDEDQNGSGQPFINIRELFGKIEKQQQSQIDDSDSFSDHGTRRGPYQKYTTKMKEEAISQVSQGLSLKQVSSRMNIPKKNIRRWLDLGAERKKGGGRKRLDEQMESKLFDWCVQESISQHRPVSRMQIRSKALKLTQFPEKFKASKGWTDKFVKKNNLRRVIIDELQHRGYYKHYQSRRKEDIEKVEKKEEISLQDGYYEYYQHQYDDSVFASSDVEVRPKKKPFLSKNIESFGLSDQIVSKTAQQN